MKEPGFMGSLLSKNKWFLAGLAVFLLATLLDILCMSKRDGFTSANFFHAPWLDQFFIKYTLLGDGLFCIILIILLFLLGKRRVSLKLLLSFAISGILAQVLKQLFAEPRPLVFMHGFPYRYFIDGVTNSGINSFPSGHTTTAFAMACTLSFNEETRRWSWAYLLLAILVGYSRIYLGQHFSIDILGGSLLGILTAFFVEYIFYRNFFNAKRARVIRSKFFE